MNVNGRPGPFIFLCFVLDNPSQCWRTVNGTVKDDHFALPKHFVLMLVKNKRNSDTAGSFHITIVSFNKHFLKLYIFIMQGSLLVDVETHGVWV